MSEKFETIQVKAHIRLPMVPNFLIYADGDGKVSIGHVPEEELANIGKRWTEALIMRARQLRDTKETGRE